jgi:hypothetical protein
MLADVNLAAEVTYTPTGGEPSRRHLVAVLLLG